MSHAYTEARVGTYQAQHGEDRWLERYFRGRRSGTYLEVGAYDGKVISNTYHFEQIGWTGVLVEPDEAKAALCRRHRPKSRVFQCAAVGDPRQREVSFAKVAGGEVYSTASLTPDHEQRIREYGLTAATVTVPAMTVDAMLEEAGVASLDFASIDVEEGEVGVLAGFDLQRWRPACVIVEENSGRREALRQAFRAQGYGFYAIIGINHVYTLCRFGLVDRARYARVAAMLRLKRAYWHAGARLLRA